MRFLWKKAGKPLRQKRKASTAGVEKDEVFFTGKRKRDGFPQGFSFPHAAVEKKLSAWN
jgi:hypothetical protein